jgi:hypothetical protein
MYRVPSHPDALARARRSIIDVGCGTGFEVYLGKGPGVCRRGPFPEDDRQARNTDLLDLPGRLTNFVAPLKALTTTLLPMMCSFTSAICPK